MRTLPPSEAEDDMSQQVRAASRAKYCRAMGEKETREPAPSEPAEPHVEVQSVRSPERETPAKSGQEPQTVEDKLAHLLGTVKAFGAQMEGDGLLASSDAVVRAYATQLYNGLGLPASHQERVVEEIVGSEKAPNLQRLSAIVTGQAESEGPDEKPNTTKEPQSEEKDEPVKGDKLDFFE